MSSSDEVNAAVQSRAQRKAQAKRILATPSEKEVAAQELAEIEREEAAERDAAEFRRAEDRMLALLKGYNSLVVGKYHDEVLQVQAAVKTLREVITTLNDRAIKLQLMRNEVDALSDRFGVHAPALKSVDRPEHAIDFTMPPLWREQIRRPNLAVHPDDESFPSNLQRMRRNYAEITGTPTFGLINEAGLKPWPAESTDAQEYRDRKRAEVEQMRTSQDLQRALEEVNATPVSVAFVPGPSSARRAI